LAVDAPGLQNLLGKVTAGVGENHKLGHGKILLTGKRWAARSFLHSKTDLFHEKKAAKAHFDIYII
jgi:hypothetical protein